MEKFGDTVLGLVAVLVIVILYTSFVFFICYIFLFGKCHNTCYITKNSKKRSLIIYKNATSFLVGIPHSVPPQPVYVNPYVHGYQAVSGFPVEEDVLLREPCLPVCGFGIGWLLFFLGFVFGGIPWYCGTFILLCVQVDYREKAGYLACALATFITMIVVTFGLTKGHHHLVW